jgi:hypothetical protein
MFGIFLPGFELKKKDGGGGRVSDPYSFFPDPDPAFEAGDQSGSGSNPYPGL